MKMNYLIKIIIKVNKQILFKNNKIILIKYIIKLQMIKILHNTRKLKIKLQKIYKNNLLSHLMLLQIIRAIKIKTLKKFQEGTLNNLHSRKNLKGSLETILFEIIGIELKYLIIVISVVILLLNIYMRNIECLLKKENEFTIYILFVIYHN